MPETNDDPKRPNTAAAPRSPSLFYAGLDNNSKRWIKKYRTEVAASSASLLSTLTAVSLVPLLHCIHLFELGEEANTNTQVSSGLCKDSNAGVRFFTFRRRAIHADCLGVDINSAVSLPV